jgi:hypothetical protein
LNNKGDLFAIQNTKISHHLRNLLATQIVKNKLNNQNSLQGLNTRITNLTNDINENIKKFTIELEFFKSMLAFLQ